MRTNTVITQTERDAYDLFCQQHNILNDDSTAAIRNGDHIGGYIVTTWNEDITEHTLRVALEQLKDALTFISPLQAEVTEILSKLDQGQRDIVATWLAKQHRLETEGDHGFSNVSVLLAWLLNRRYAITEQGLTMALGNCQTNGRRKLYWKEGPKQDRSYGPGGRINWALVNKSEEGFMPRSQTNRTPRQVAEDNRPKLETQLTPVSVNVEYQMKAESLVGRSHGQTDQARKLFVMVPGTSTIDWQQTHAARVRFLNTQVPLIRR
jgi:hypothetical protein